MTIGEYEGEDLRQSRKKHVNSQKMYDKCDEKWFVYGKERFIIKTRYR